MEIDIEVPPLPPQDPCQWCRGDQLSLLICKCVRVCDADDCPMAREGSEMQPVPQFADYLRSLVAETKLVGQTTVVSDQTPARDAEKTLRLVQELHAKCPCKVCAAGTSRPVCASCQDFWPCKTINVIRGI